MYYIFIIAVLILVAYLRIQANGKKWDKKNKIKEEKWHTEELRSNLSRSIDSIKQESKHIQNDLLKEVAQRYADNDKKHHSNISLHNQFDKIKYVSHFSDVEYSLMIDRVTSKVLNEFIEPIDEAK